MALPGPEDPTLVKISWLNTGATSAYTKVYTKFGAGAWTLLSTRNPGQTSYNTGYTRQTGRHFGVAHYDAVTGLTSAVVDGGDGLS